MSSTGHLELPEQPEEARVVMGRGHGRNFSAASSVAGTAQIPSFSTCQGFPPGKLLVLQSLGAAIGLAERKKHSVN